MMVQHPLLLQIGVAPLADNNPNDKYLYEVAVFTGMRRNAGTTSNVSEAFLSITHAVIQKGCWAHKNVAATLQVHMILSGEFDESDTRVLRDKRRRTLQRGGVDAFLMATERCGELCRELSAPRKHAHETKFRLLFPVCFDVRRSLKIALLL